MGCCRMLSWIGGVTLSTISVGRTYATRYWRRTTWCMLLAGRFFHKVKLVREPMRPLPNGGDLTLEDLLKYKSQEGVRVLLLVRDYKTSHSKFFIETEGVMQTHNEETQKFFKHYSVTCPMLWELFTLTIRNV